jgi:type I restriction enzyme, S subunit
MIAGLKPYQEYKESGLPWVATMPAHWSQRRMKFLFRERVQKGFPDEPLLAATQSKGVVRKADYGERTVTVTKDFHLLKLVEPGDYVISLRSFEGGIEVAHCRGIISPAYTVLAPRPEAQSGYFTRFFKSPDFIRSLTLFVTGIREGQNIDYQRLSRAYMHLPPPEEQAAMVRFLDYANGRLERAVRAKRKVIALLHEQKQAIIHRAVTRGLHPTVPLKPSGIPWLGEIPENWEVRPLKQLLARMDYGTSENGRGEGRVRMLTMGHIREGKILFPRKGSLDAVPPGLLLEKNDLLFNRTNSPELVGKVGLFAGDASDEITFASYLVRLRARSEHSPFWLNYLLNSTGFWSYARSQALVSLHQANLNSTRYGQMVLPVPSTRAEQDGIVDLIRSQAGEIERAISRLEREISLLREYRTRLVADVVTGKLDVRPAARQLPEEGGELSEGAEQSEGLDGSDLSGETPLE